MIRLDYRDGTKEFGLSEWNEAIDSMYWGLALVLIIPLISAYNQPDKNLDIGQFMADILLTILVISPFLFSIYVRGLRVPTARLSALEESKKTGNDAAIDDFSKQTIWPLQRARNKYGMLLCGGMLAANLSVPSPIPELVDFLKSIGSVFGF